MTEGEILANLGKVTATWFIYGCIALTAYLVIGSMIARIMDMTRRPAVYARLYKRKAIFCAWGVVALFQFLILAAALIAIPLLVLDFLFNGFGHLGELSTTEILLIMIYIKISQQENKTNA